MQTPESTDTSLAVSDAPATESAHSNAVATDALIQKKVLWSLGAGIVPLPLIDLAAIATVQYTLLKELSELYGKDFSAERCKKHISVLTASVGTGTLLTGTAASLLKIFPGVGCLAGGIALPAVAGASTYALGKVFQHHFERGGDLLNFEQEKAKDYFNKAYAEGEKVVAKLKSEIKAHC